MPLTIRLQLPLLLSMLETVVLFFFIIIIICLELVIGNFWGVH